MRGRRARRREPPSAGGCAGREPRTRPGRRAAARACSLVHQRSHTLREVGDGGLLRRLRRPGEDATLEAQRLVQRLELAGELLERAPPPADVAVRAGELAEDSLERAPAVTAARDRQ